MCPPALTSRARPGPGSAFPPSSISEFQRGSRLYNRLDQPDGRVDPTGQLGHSPHCLEALFHVSSLPCWPRTAAVPIKSICCEQRRPSTPPSYIPSRRGFACGSKRRKHGLAPSGVLLFTPWRPAAPLHRCHPGRRTAPAFAAASGQSLQSDDGLVKVLTLRPKLGEHFLDFHASRIAYRGLDLRDLAAWSTVFPGAPDSKAERTSGESGNFVSVLESTFT